MVLTKEKTVEMVASYGKSDKDTGASEVQVALLSTRISHLTEHLKEHKKDFSTRLGMLKMVGQRRRLLNYLKKHRSHDDYKALLDKLGLRK